VLALLLLSCVYLSGCANGDKQTGQSDLTAETGAAGDADMEDGTIEYKNTEYGFSFALPESWKGYQIVDERWEGLAIGGRQGGEVVETGPLVSIRHPQWTSRNQRQDIPIMVFTLTQWDALQREEFHIGAAPVGPKELGRNSEYVFALPARYNFAFPTGYEEVEEILAGDPLQPD